MKSLILGFGNELIADDAVGILAARRLKTEIMGRADVVESGVAGLAVLDLITGYKNLIIIDAIKATDHPAGTILDFPFDRLRHIPIPSPHYAGLPEIFELGRQMNLDLPTNIRVFAIVAQDLTTVGGPISQAVVDSFEELISRIKAAVAELDK